MPLLNIYEMQIFICDGSFFHSWPYQICTEIVLHIIMDRTGFTSFWTNLIFMHLHELIFFLECLYFFLVCVESFIIYMCFYSIVLFLVFRGSLFCFMLILTINLCYLFKRIVQFGVDSHEKLIKTYMKRKKMCLKLFYWLLKSGICVFLFLWHFMGSEWMNAF